MAYELTLAASERQAFDWVGYRYSSPGDAMADLIRSGEWEGESALRDSNGNTIGSAKIENE
jgi:hypothetical protein